MTGLASLRLRQECVSFETYFTAMIFQLRLVDALHVVGETIHSVGLSTG
jgi:hypothetical protein